VAATKASDLALSGLTKVFGTTPAVDGVTLRIAAGEMVALLGPSGCGKTTTLRMVAGLIEPTEGDVLIGGVRITRTPVHRRNIGMLFQNYALFPHLSVAENVAFGLQMRGLGKSAIRPKVDAALALVQLSAFADRLPSALSGGQQQRVALARAIVIEPTLLLLDEPLGALDRNLRDSMQVEIRQIQQRLGITAVMVTHDQEEALTMADRVVIMRDGRLEQVGTPEEIYSRPTSRFVASFIGACNFLRGNVTGQEANKLQVQLLAGGQVALPSSRDSRKEVLVSVRPEAVALDVLGAGAPASQGGTPATIQQIVYRGQATHVHMSLDDGAPLLAFLPNRHGKQAHSAFSVGDRVWASWSPESNWAVSDA
jgi:putative spermidine/putrescine transport system ATP-binding protein